ncbi:HAMP domain-containing sensor histidine kinase [Fusobacterium sp.]|jgi:two-component system phosphate regulon sensor histidine kinase PhoR|uniref:HAMP domain-containing sensor histidine kinase n=1 Tax=Fusobacterium sp. TaxID=68766 RepID=UPI000C700B32|nr:HAMP domain-containing sensor histidine kinase [Fusobacterium sp.]
MKKKFLSICFFLIFITSLTSGLIFNKMMKDNYIETAYLAALSQGNIISIFLSENKNHYLPVFRLAQFFSNKSEYRVTFLDEKGTPIADSHDNSIIFTSYENTPLFKANNLNLPTYRITSSSDKKYKILEVFSNKVTINNKNVILMLSKKLTFFNDFQKKIAGTIIFSILFSGIISIILSVIVVNKIVNPILNLTKALKNVALGNFNTSLIKLHTNDEIQELSNNFIFMQDKINNLLQTIKSKANNLQLILNNLQTSIFVISKNGEIILVNNQAIKEFSFEKEYKSIFDYPQLQFFINDVKEAIINNKTINIKKSVENKVYKIKLNYIKDTSNQIIITVQDISKIENTEKMRREFVSNASHELKTPITIISGFIETIKLGHVKDPKQLSHFIDIIENEVKRLNLLTTSLLTLSNSENTLTNNKKEYTFNLQDELNSIISLYENIAKKQKITIIQTIENKEITAPISHEWIRTVFGNILDNAIKYSTEESKIYINSFILNSKLIISVKDHGIGIDKKDLQNIFRRFYRVDKSRNSKTGGTGLGLAIVKNMITNVNGKIKVESQLNKGTTFTISIPIKF